MNLHCSAHFSGNETTVLFMRESSDPPYLVHAGMSVYAGSLVPVRNVLASMCKSWYVDRKISPIGVLCDIRVDSSSELADGEILCEENPRVIVKK